MPRSPRSAGVDVLFAPAGGGDVPARASRPGSRSTELARRPRGRVPARPLPRRRDRLPEALQPRPPAIAPTSARRTRSRSPSSAAGARPRRSRSSCASCRRCATPTASRSRRATRASRRRSARPRSRFPRALATRDRAARASRRSSRGLERRLRRGRATSTAPVLAAAVRVGSTRLIDNVPLRGGPHEHPPAYARARHARARQAAAARARRDEAPRRQQIVMVTAYDAPSRPARRRRRRRPDPRRRLGRDGRARPRLDRARRRWTR